MPAKTYSAEELAYLRQWERTDRGRLVRVVGGYRQTIFPATYGRGYTLCMVGTDGKPIYTGPFKTERYAARIADHHVGLSDS